VSAIFGEGVGYVPCPDAAEVYANEAGTELGRNSYFVAEPCASTTEGPFFFLQTADTNHSGDPQYNSYSGGLSVGYNPYAIPSGPTSVLQQVGSTTPEYGISTSQPGRRSREWLALPTTADLTTWQFVYNSSFGVGVGVFLLPDVFSDLGTFPGSTAADKYLDATPFLVVSEGEAITLPAGDYWMSPWGGTSAFHSDIGVDLWYWPRDNADGITDSRSDAIGHDAWVASVTYTTYT
jgi:hypothetical protein